MKKITHIPLKIDRLQSVQMSFNTDILGVLVIDNVPNIIAITDDGYSMLMRNFLMIGKDLELPQRTNITNYIGSFEYKDNKTPITIHLFEEK